MKRIGKESILCVFVAIAIVASLVVAVSRVQIESANHTVRMAATAEDMASFAAGQGKSLTATMAEAKEHGLTDVLFKETSLGDLERNGKIQLIEGFGIRDLAAKTPLPPNLPIEEAYLYVVPQDVETDHMLASHLIARWPGTKRYGGELGVYAIASMVPTSEQEVESARKNLLDVGLGFDKAGIEAAEAAKLGQMVQIRTPSYGESDGLRLIKDDVKGIPNLSLILFNDKSLPGYPDMASLYALLSDDQGKVFAPFGTIEFNDQEGMKKLALLSGKQVLRLHTIANKEMAGFLADGKEHTGAIDRWKLAVSERNMRVLLVRFFHIDNPAASWQENLHYLNQIATGIDEKGYSLSEDVTPMGPVHTGILLQSLVALGVAGGCGLLWLTLRGSLRWAYVWAALSMIGFLGLYLLGYGVLARKLMALVGVVVFPSFSSIRFLNVRALNLGASIVRLICMSLMSFIGAVLMVGLLSDMLFMLKLDYFSGVKLAHALPLLLVPMVLYIWQDKEPVQALYTLFNRAVSYRWFVMMGVVAVAIGIYLMRTGNAGTEIPGAEAHLRQALTDFLGVRPRTKEFLIGYPLTLLYFYFGGKKPSFWVLTVAAVIGQVSLVNTYAHIHTPLLVSLARSGWGLVIGVVLGVVAIGVVRFLIQIGTQGVRQKRRRGHGA